MKTAAAVEAVKTTTFIIIGVIYGGVFLGVIGLGMWSYLVATRF